MTYIDKEISAMILVGNRAFYELENSVRIRSVSRELKTQLYSTLLRPIMTFGAKTWPLQKEDERKLIVRERKVLRKIYGLMKDSYSDKCRITTNNELELLFHKSRILY